MIKNETTTYPIKWYSGQGIGKYNHLFYVENNNEEKINQWTAISSNEIGFAGYNTSYTIKKNTLSGKFFKDRIQRIVFQSKGKTISFNFVGEFSFETYKEYDK